MLLYHAYFYFFHFILFGTFKTTILECVFFLLHIVVYCTLAVFSVCYVYMCNNTQSSNQGEPKLHVTKYYCIVLVL